MGWVDLGVLVARSAELKRELVEFSQRPRAVGGGVVETELHLRVACVEGFPLIGH
jgi:hypothetical protein